MMRAVEHASEKVLPTGHRNQSCIRWNVQICGQQRYLRFQWPLRTQHRRPTGRGDAAETLKFETVCISSPRLMREETPSQA